MGAAGLLAASMANGWLRATDAGGPAISKVAAVRTNKQTT
jgi:hypothetical protein